MKLDHDQNSPVLKVTDLETRFRSHAGNTFAVNGVSLELGSGETLGIVGESGCGKSVTVLSVLQLIPKTNGEIVNGSAWFNGMDLLKLSEKEICKVRGAQIGMVFQDPMTSLNPVITIGQQLSEPLTTHLGLSKKEAKKQAVKLLTLVGITDTENRYNQYPHQFSGGMRQRAMIAMALACSPKILIADEPTTALDVTIQAQIIELVKRLRDEMGMSIIWITHDLGIIAGFAQRVMVMYAGYVIEEALVDDLYAHPQHPYTVGLLNSLPSMDDTDKEQLTDIPGLPPVLSKKPMICPFAPRCSYAIDRCKENPPLMEVGARHRVACWWNIQEKEPRRVS